MAIATLRAVLLPGDVNDQAGFPAAFGIERLEDLAKVLALPGQTPARSHEVLATILAGLKAFEADPSLLEKVRADR